MASRLASSSVVVYPHTPVDTWGGGCLGVCLLVPLHAVVPHDPGVSVGLVVPEGGEGPCRYVVGLLGPHDVRRWTASRLVSECRTSSYGNVFCPAPRGCTPCCPLSPVLHRRSLPLVLGALIVLNVPVVGVFVVVVEIPNVSGVELLFVAVEIAGRILGALLTGVPRQDVKKRRCERLSRRGWHGSWTHSRGRLGRPSPRWNAAPPPKQHKWAALPRGPVSSWVWANNTTDGTPGTWGSLAWQLDVLPGGA